MRWTSGSHIFRTNILGSQRIKTVHKLFCIYIRTKSVKSVFSLSLQPIYAVVNYILKTLKITKLFSHPNFSEILSATWKSSAATERTWHDSVRPIHVFLNIHGFCWFGWFTTFILGGDKMLICICLRILYTFETNMCQSLCLFVFAVDVFYFCGLLLSFLILLK